MINIKKSLTILTGTDDAKSNLLYELYIKDENPNKMCFHNEIFYLDKINCDVVYWDLPENQAHPKQQLQIAKDLIKLSKKKKIIFTTNSDYIIQHVNNMIKLNNNSNKNELMKEFNYTNDDLLNETEIDIYDINFDDINKLICGKYGFKVKSFNEVIDSLFKEIFSFQNDD